MRRPLVGAVLAVVLVLCGCAREPVAEAPPSAPPASPQAPSSPAPQPPSPPPLPTPAAEPVALTIPAIGVEAEIVPVGLKADGSMETPDFGLAGWYTEGPRPGDPGPAVVVAHVDSRSGPDVFYRLRELQAGDQITVQQADGRTAGFVVESSQQTDKDQLPTDRIWNQTTDPVLRLITCGGAFNNDTRHYEDNIIVYAQPATTP